VIWLRQECFGLIGIHRAGIAFRTAFDRDAQHGRALSCLLWSFIGQENEKALDACQSAIPCGDFDLAGFLQII